MRKLLLEEFRIQNRFAFGFNLLRRITRLYRIILDNATINKKRFIKKTKKY